MKPSHFIGIAVLAVVCAVHDARAADPTGSFNVDVSAAPTPGQVIPKLTWSTTPAAMSCTASGDWTGAKAAAGTVTLPATIPPKSYTLACVWAGDGVATLSWTPPTKNTDDSPLTDLAGYRILYGPSASNLTQLIELKNPTQATYAVDNLTAGTWYFGVKAYTATGAESSLSNIVSKTITAPFTLTHTVDIKQPKAPVVTVK